LRRGEIILKKLTTIFLFFTFANYSFSQWVNIGPPSNLTVRAVNGFGNYKFAGVDFSGVWVSTNNGSNWTDSPLNNHDIYSLVVWGSNVCAGSDVGGYIYYSSNLGQSWNQTTLNGQIVYSLAVSVNTIFAGSNGNGVFYSTNYGQNWIQTPLNNRVVASLAALGDNVFAGTDPYGVYLSTNSGQGWSQTSLNNKIVMALAITPNGTNILAGTNDAGVYISSNNGSNWTQILNVLYVTSIAVDNSNYYVGTADSGVYFSGNGGQTWTQKNEGLGDLSVSSLYLQPYGYIYAGTTFHSVYRRPLSDFTGLKNPGGQIPKNFSLSQNYPNPFNPSTNIKFVVPKSSFITITIYDVLGREITTLVNEQLKPGNYSVDWDAGKYASGVYFYKLSAGYFSETKLMVLLK